MIVPDEEGLSRHLLVPHDPMRNEVTCAFDGFCKSRVKVSKVDPLGVLDDLSTVENVKIEVGHGLKPHSPGKSSRPVSKMLRFSVMQEYRLLHVLHDYR